VIVIGHEAEGCGNTMLCLHIAVALMAQSQRVVLFDLDGRRKGLTRAFANRMGFANRTGLRPLLPDYAYLGGGGTESIIDTLARAFSSVEADHDFIVIDASCIDADFSRLIYSLADTLILPFTPGELDLAIDMTADAELFDSGGIRSIGEGIRQARSDRRKLDSTEFDVIMVRNRVPLTASGVSGRFADRLAKAAMEYGFRTVEGLHEREAYRRWFDQGLTVFDQGEEIAGAACLTEAKAMVEDLKLPLNEAGRKRAAARAQWSAAALKPLAMDEILAS
jgi:chromosome partitioning protein